MKTKLMLVLGMVGILLAAVACSAAPKETQLEVTIEQFMKDKHITRPVEVDDGSTLRVILGSNPTTGFQWTEQAEIGDQAVLEQKEHKFVPPGSNVVGAAGKEVWTFKALKAGTTTVSMEYSRPWQGGEKSEWTFKLTVVVK